MHALRWTTFAMMLALTLAGCEASLGSGADAARPDAAQDGSTFDAGARADASASVDAGPGDDGGAAFDGGTDPMRDAGFDAAVDAAPEPPCAEPLGSACNPIVIDTLPFRHESDTAVAGESLIEHYACAPTLREGGPEIHYELRLSEAQRVTFTLEEASGVDVDVHILRSPEPSSCIARANTTLEERLGPGHWRVVVDTYDSLSRAGGYALNVRAEAPATRSLGTMWNTYYYLANEDDHSGPRDTPIYDASCNEIARVRAGFHNSVCIEGSGRLADGRIINYASTCTNSCTRARLCGSQSYRICYSVLDPERFPWGQGAMSNPLEPDRSMAVDRNFIALGTWVYFEELDGLIPPGASEPHDGCLRADDVGGAINGNHFDFFAGTRDRWRAWEMLLPTRSTLHAHADHPRCYPRP